MRKVNIYPADRTTVKLPNASITSITFGAMLTNQEIYDCITQKAIVMEVFNNGLTKKITLANIKEDLEKEAEDEALAKKDREAQLEKQISDLNRVISDIKGDHIFETVDAAKTYATTTTTKIGEIVSIYNSTTSSYDVYTINPDRTLKLFQSGSSNANSIITVIQ